MPDIRSSARSSAYSRSSSSLRPTSSTPPPSSSRSSARRSARRSVAACDQIWDETLLHLSTRVEQVLSLQTQMEQQVSTLVAGQAASHCAIMDMSKSLGTGQERRVTRHGSAQAADASAPVTRVMSQAYVSHENESPTLVSFPGLDQLPKEPAPGQSGKEISVAAEKSMADGKSMASRMADGRSMAEDLRGARVSKPCRSTTIQIFNPTLPMFSTMTSDFADIAASEEDDLNERLDTVMSGCYAMDSIRDQIDNPGSEYTIHPHSSVRIVHDLASILVMGLDVISAPVVLAWNLELEGVLFVLSIISLTFWTFDIAMSFITGFYAQGELEPRLRQVVKRYLKSWFIPDLMIVMADSLTLALDGLSDSSRETGSGFLRLSKVSRFLRLVRLFRLARIADSLTRLMEANVVAEVLVETVKPLLIIAVINHFLACSWWSISNYLPSDTGLRWIDEAMGDSIDMSYREVNILYQYLTCVHWSLSQLTPGTMQVAPLNSIERAFACFGLLLGMLIFSSLISSVSAKLMQHYVKQKDKLAKLNALRKFLGSNVRQSIRIAAQFHAQKVLFGSTGKPVVKGDVFVITMLPQALQRSIQVELCAKHLQHPLLRWWFIIDPKGAHALCCTAIEFIALAAEDHLFFARAAATGAYIMTAGSAMYLLDTEQNLNSQSMEMMLEMSHREVHQNCFFCEAALWSAWKHVGELTATTGCSLLWLRTDKFIKCLDEDFVVKHVVAQYGRSFFLRLIGPHLGEAEKPNDLSVPFTDFGSILLSLPPKCKQLIGAAAVNVHRQKQVWPDLSDSNMQQLRDGTCCMMVNWDGEVQRIVSVIAVHLEDPDGRILARLGTWDGSRMQASCDLPGCKVTYGETPPQAFERFFTGSFAPFADQIRSLGDEQEIHYKKSKRFDVQTKYVRTVKIAELSCPPEHLGLEATQISLRAQGHGSRRNERAPHSNRKWSLNSSSMTGSVNGKMFSEDDMEGYVVAEPGGDMYIVAWVSSEDLHFFSTAEGDAQLTATMKDVSLGPRMYEAAMARLNSEDSEISM